MADELKQITDYEWGKDGRVKVRLDNRPDPPIHEKLLRQIVDKADLPSCRLLLILEKKEAPVAFPCRAMAFLREDLDIIISHKYAMTEGIRRNAIGQHNIDAPKDDWQYGVYIPGVTAELWTELPACFAFYVLHELEHVRIMLRDPNFHRFASWTLKNWAEFFPDGKQPKGKNWDWPWELHCNREGKRLAIEMSEKEPLPFIEALSCQVANESNESPEHAEYLEFIRTLPCGAKKDKSIDSLCSEIQMRIDDEGVRDGIYSKWQQRQVGAKLASRFNLPDFLPPV